MTRTWYTGDELLILFRYNAEGMTVEAKKQARHQIRLNTGLASEPGSPKTNPTYDRKEANEAWAKWQALAVAA